MGAVHRNIRPTTSSRLFDNETPEVCALTRAEGCLKQRHDCDKATSPKTKNVECVAATVKENLKKQSPKMESSESCSRTLVRFSF